MSGWPSTTHPASTLNRSFELMKGVLDWMNWTCVCTITINQWYVFSMLHLFRDLGSEWPPYVKHSSQCRIHPPWHTEQSTNAMVGPSKAFEILEVRSISQIKVLSIIRMVICRFMLTVGVLCYLRTWPLPLPSCYLLLILLFPSPSWYLLNDGIGATNYVWWGIFAWGSHGFVS